MSYILLLLLLVSLDIRLKFVRFTYKKKASKSSQKEFMHSKYVQLCSICFYSCVSVCILYNHNAI